MLKLIISILLILIILAAIVSAYRKTDKELNDAFKRIFKDRDDER